MRIRYPMEEGILIPFSIFLLERRKIMALFKIFKGNVENLPLEKHEGYAYFTEDTKELYIDINNNTRVQVNAEKLSRTIDNSTETIEIDDILEL